MQEPNRLALLLVTVLLVSCRTSGALRLQDATQASKPNVLITEEPEGLSVHIGEQPFTEYRVNNCGHTPILFPLLLADGTSMTRHWPIEERPLEQQDHPHHRSIWFAHGDVNGWDFWSGGDGSTIQHLETLELSSGDVGSFVVAAAWLNPEGKAIANEKKRMTFRGEPGMRMLDMDLTVSPTDAALVFGDTKEGTFAARIAAPLRLRGEAATGHILNSEGHQDGACWGRRARWVHYFGRIDENPVGVLMFDHPQNHAYPTWWHVRDYGLFAANPFGVHDFEKTEPSRGDLRVEVGETLRFRYRVIFHRGEWTPEIINRHFENYVRESTDR